MPRKVLLPGASRPNSHPHCTMPRMRSDEKDTKCQHYTPAHRHVQNSNGPRRRTTNGHRPLRRPFGRIHCSHHSDGCILPLSICVQRHQNRHQDCHTGPYRYHKTLLSSHNDNHGQRIPVHIGGNATNNSHSRNPTETCHHKTCTDDRHPRKDTRLAQRKPKNHDGREANDVAPILTNGSLKLQHFLPHIIRLRTQPSFPWKSAKQRTRPKVRP